MIKPVRFAFFAAFLLFTLSCTASAQTNKKVIGYGNLYWGDSYENVEKTYSLLIELPVTKGYSEGEYMLDYIHDDDFAIGIRAFKQININSDDIKARVFRFYNGQLYRVDVFYWLHSTHSLGPQMIQRYGPSGNLSTSQLLEFWEKDYRLIWENVNGTLINVCPPLWISFSGTYSETYVIYSSIEYYSIVEAVMEKYKLDKKTSNTFDF